MEPSVSFKTIRGEVDRAAGLIFRHRDGANPRPLRVIARVRLFEIFLDGRKLFEVEDDAFSTSGRVGLGTKADSVTLFDDLRVQSLDQR